MAAFPLPEGFFPPVALSADDAARYRRTSKERVAQLVRILEDAECAYQWTALPPNAGNGGVSRRASRAAASRPVVCHRAQFLDLRPTSKAASASTLLKASALVADVRADEVLSVAAKSSTREFRRLMATLLGSTFVDGRTLATLPSSGRSAAHSQAVPHYRAIKWHCLETASPPTKLLDFVYLEYAGRRSPRPGSSSVVAFCVQTAVERPEVPVLPGVERCSLPRVGLIVSRVPHQRSTCRVTALCQLDSPSPELAAVMQRWVVASISRLNALLERQRVGRLRFVEQWQWIPNGERQACAVCLRGFFFHRKHHCRTCGEVVCSSCAPLRELEEPILDIPTLRVCSACLLSAAALPTGEQIEQSRTTSDDSRAELVSPRHDEYEEVDVALRGRARLGRALRPQDKLQVLTNVVSRIRDIRDTIDLTIAEVDEREPSDAAEAANARPTIEREHSEMRSIRDALESSVSRFDAALVRATTGDSEVERSTADRSTDDEFRSVARITLAAAHATQQAGQAFLSAGRAGRASLHADEDGAFLPPPLYREESSALLSSDDEDPYSAGNYEKLLARSTSGTGTDTVERPTTRSTQIRALEEQIRALQLSLEDAQRKLSVMENDPLDAPFGKENDPLYFHKENARALYPMYPEGDELVAELRGVMTDEPFADVVASPIAALPESESDFGWSPVKLTPPSRSPRPTKPRLSGATASSSPPSSLYQQRRVVTPQALGISDSGEPDDSDDLDDDSDDDDSERFESEPHFRPPPSAMPPTFYVEESLRPAVPGRRSTARYSARPRSASLPGVDREERPVDRPDQSEDGGTSGPTALYVDHALRALRSTLAALRCECPSAADRRRKLAAVIEVLSALRREGVRSRYRTLPHEEVHYAALMEKTPSVVKLLRIAGYVSLPHYLVMRRVDPEFLGLVLAELELETR